MSHWRRTRMISFRVSEREFEMLKALSESEGARSVSDFARVALCGPSLQAPRDQPNGAITQLSRDVEDLKARLRRVAEMLEQQTAVPDGRNVTPAGGRRQPRTGP